MNRYKRLTKENVYEALNRLRLAFLAAKDGDEVNEIILGLLTQDERLKIGRRIQISQLIKQEMTLRDIAQELKVGVGTVETVNKKMTQHPKCYELIDRRDEKVEQEYKKKAYVKTGGPKLIFKRTEYTGFKRSKVKR